MSKIYQEAEKFINEQFHKNSYDARSKLNVSEIVGNKLLAKQEKSDGDWHMPKPGVVHVSKLYGCLRGVFHEMTGVKADVQEEFDKRRMAGVFEAGHMFEDFIVDSLGDRVLERQREYVYKYKNLTLVGHSDYRVDDEGIMRIGENKSVHSDAFWYRKNEGTLIQWHNQEQLQTYLWLERILFNNEWEGIFSYISKDDCTIEHGAIKFNPGIIEEVVKPILDLLDEAYTRAMPLLKTREELMARAAVSPDDAHEIDEALAEIADSLKTIGNSLPAPDLAIYNSGRGQWTTNWLAKYCNHHCTCAGAGWLLEAGAEVKRKNSEHKASIVKSIGGHVEPKAKPKIGIASEGAQS